MGAARFCFGRPHPLGATRAVHSVCRDMCLKGRRGGGAASSVAWQGSVSMRVDKHVSSDGVLVPAAVCFATFTHGMSCRRACTPVESQLRLRTSAKYIES